MTVCLVATLLIASACTPTIKVEAPSQPIEINLNVKIEHEIRIKVEKDLEDLFEDESDIF
ncbi:MAG: YnbE family lipoprotein [bacterium]|nr:YnbE family lipoprotein [Gammaproteobacteria bacterium]